MELIKPILILCIHILPLLIASGKLLQYHQSRPNTGWCLKLCPSTFFPPLLRNQLCLTQYNSQYILSVAPSVSVWIFFPFEIFISFLYATKFLATVTASVAAWVLLFFSLRCEPDFTAYYSPFQFDVNLGQISPHFNIPQNHCTYVAPVRLSPWYSKMMLQIYTASVAVIQYSAIM